MKIEERKDFRPLCPHCEGSISTLVKVTHGHMEKHKIYCCPHCRKILGIGSSSG
jgi:uncharacterized protein with PIN domain